jgi:hypothetical protein
MLEAKKERKKERKKTKIRSKVKINKGNVERKNGIKGSQKETKVKARKDTKREQNKQGKI